MNFDPNISNTVAVLLGLLGPAMWGSWFICLKYLDDYPIEAYYITLFTGSMIVVWGAGFILDGQYLVGNIRLVWATDPSRIYVTFICGILYVIGMQISLRVMKLIGLSLAQPIQSSISAIVGTFLSGVIGGVPQSLPPSRIALAVFFLVVAIYLTMKAGRVRNRAQDEANIDTGISRDPGDIIKSVGLLLLSSVFVPAYTSALSYGLRSVTQQNGMAVMPFMAILCTGAFTGSLLISGVTLTIRQQWHVFLEHGWKIHRLGAISGVAHYGGNIIHTFATRHLSSVVSWPLGMTSGFWTQMWGLAYGEFEGAPKKAYAFLFSGIACYVLGAYFIANL